MFQPDIFTLKKPPGWPSQLSDCAQGALLGRPCQVWTAPDATWTDGFPGGFPIHWSWQHKWGTWWEHDGNMMGIWWEYDGNIMGTSWEHHGNMMGIWWEHDGNMMGIWWEHHGNMIGMMMFVFGSYLFSSQGYIPLLFDHLLGLVLGENCKFFPWI